MVLFGKLAVLIVVVQQQVFDALCSRCIHRPPLLIEEEPSFRVYLRAN
jgi:hypothetical protein